MYAGQISLTEYGFGNNATDILSPGPTLNFTVGEIVNMTVYNVGTMGHNWALTTQNATDAKVLFGSQIASGSAPIPVNGTGSVIFKVTKSGNLLLHLPSSRACAVGHVGQRGSEPLKGHFAQEFSASCLFFFASLLTGLVSLVAFGFVWAKQGGEKPSEPPGCRRVPCG